MYTILGNEQISIINDIPLPNVGAPMPSIIANDGAVIVTYICQSHDPTWDGSTVRVIDANSNGETIAIVKFSRVKGHYFGSPNDEAFSGHPLSRLGLKPYDVSQVKPSGWIADLERMNSIHPRHDVKRFHSLKHYIFAFHDTIFEIVCDSYSVEMFSGSINESIILASKKLL